MKREPISAESATGRRTRSGYQESLPEETVEGLKAGRGELSAFKKKARTKAAIIYGLTTIIPLLVMVYIIQTHVVLGEGMGLAWISSLGVLAVAIGLLGGKLMKETWRRMGEALEAIERLRKVSGPPPNVAKNRGANDIGRVPAVVNHLVDMARKQRVKLREHTEQLQSLSRRIKEANEQLQKIVREDWLTGLYSRRHFSELLVKEIERARRYGRDLSLAMIEPDSIGDSGGTAGAQVNDETLIAIATAIQKAIRQVDVPSRYDSHRFAILFPETSVERALVALDRIRTAMDEHRCGGKPDAPEGELSVSVGLAMLCKDHDRAGDFVASADKALCEAKSRGCGQTAAYSPSQVMLRGSTVR